MTLARAQRHSSHGPAAPGARRPGRASSRLITKATIHLVGTTLIAGCAALISWSCGGDDDSTPQPTTDSGASNDVNNNNGDSGTSDVATNDAPSNPDTGGPPIVNCNQTSPFGAPVLIDTLSSAYNDQSAGLSENELVATFVSERADAGNLLVFTAARTSTTAAWGTPKLETAVNDTRNYDVTVAADGKTMVLAHGNVSTRLWISSRTTTGGAAWGVPVLWAQSINGDAQPFLLPDGSAIYFSRGGKILRAARAGATFDAPAPVTWVTDPKEPRSPVVTADELTMYFGDRPSGGNGPYEILVSRRAKATDPWGAGTYVTELNTISADWPSWTTPNGCVLYFASNGLYNDDSGAGSPNGFDIWMATRGN